MLLKNWLLNARKYNLMTLYLYYLIIGAPGRGWVMQEIFKIVF